MKKKLRRYLLAKPAAQECFPFSPDVSVYKVENKIFALYFCDTRGEFINLKCEPEQAQQLRDVFREIKPGYHMNKKHWNTIELTGTVPECEILRLIDHSYELVVKRLPRTVRQRLRLHHADLSWLKV